MDYYEILGVKPNATEVQIRNGYIAQSLQYHPDRNSSSEATEKFQEIATAFYVLSDRERRQKYDESHNIVVSDSINPIKIFSEIFDDLLVPEVPNPTYWWQPIGTVAGSCLGFIVFNIPGAIIGGYYGSKSGKIRDMKGTSVYEAYCKLSKEKRTEIMNSLGKKFVSHAIRN